MSHVASASSMMNDFFPAITSVAYGHSSAKEAFEAYERANAEDSEDHDVSLDDDSSAHERFDRRFRFFSDN